MANFGVDKLYCFTQLFVEYLFHVFVAVEVDVGSD